MSGNSETRENVSIIGIIGGIGPQAGIDFTEKIIANTRALRDQDHLNCMLISCPSLIPDRTEFILQGKNEDENPAFGMFECAGRLYAAGVRIAVVACNTAHAERIYSPFRAMVEKSCPGLQIVNLLETTAIYTKEKLKTRNIGLLATLGTHKSRVYHEYFRPEDGFFLIEPDEAGQKMVHEAIYNEEFGIKAHSQNLSSRAKNLIMKELLSLIARGAEAIILGCTELPLALSGSVFRVPVIDPGLVAVRRLIELTAPEKLLPL